MKKALGKMPRAFSIGSPANTPKRSYFVVVFPISLYRITKEAWKIGDPEHPHAISKWPLKSTTP